MTKNNRNKAVAQAIFTAATLGWLIMQVESAQAATLMLNNLNDGSNITTPSITINSPGLITIPNSTSSDNSGQINVASNNGGNIILSTGNLTLTRVPEPSAIAGIILAGSLAWLVKRKQVFISKDSE
ncbi:MAG: PEP-CTERM sorting domain-containing protein [Nostoc sp.]|uniref:PEP-CTERM sorting domain-containing protein n=1 Tax=Nostoc sp. TaxID=1180 RepID=UPI002FFA97E4